MGLVLGLLGSGCLCPSPWATAPCHRVTVSRVSAEAMLVRGAEDRQEGGEPH